MTLDMWLALGILLLLPLGDLFSNRTLTILFTIGQCVGLIGMTLAQSFVTFTAGSTLLGFFIFVTPMTAQGGLYILLSMSGGFIYSYAKISETRQLRT